MKIPRVVILVSSARHIPFFLRIHDEFLARHISCQFAAHLQELKPAGSADDVVYLVDSTDADDGRLLDLAAAMRDLQARAALLFIEARRVQTPIAHYSRKVFMLSSDASPETVVDFVFNHRALRVVPPARAEAGPVATGRGASFVSA
ncbi:hypothetical protein GFK26_12905 [Variovorax paradoxus]|uniref:Uncharacterized protein n=1 Tax=Variovorax paradoxus TaxID=34073 RepID=A0A5Q0M2X0_VARPD|nr:hypothetical protein [Variovorax paradoxus]QFZ83588.1 hypothetical protein GFK26_12905 [Variovorax paradoxus]